MSGCGVGGCQSVRKSRGLCALHYEHWRLGDHALDAAAMPRYAQGRPALAPREERELARLDAAIAVRPVETRRHIERVWTCLLCAETWSGVGAACPRCGGRGVRAWAYRQDLNEVIP